MADASNRKVGSPVLARSIVCKIPLKSQTIFLLFRFFLSPVVFKFNALNRNVMHFGLYLNET